MTAPEKMWRSEIGKYPMYPDGGAFYHETAPKEPAEEYTRSDLLTAALTQSRAETQAALAGCVKIKPLVWHKSAINPWAGDWHTIPTGYTVRCADENGWKWSCNGAFGYCHSDEAAKAAAQADYEARSRAAIQPDTSKLALVREALQSGIDLIRGEAVGADWKRGCNDFVKQASAAIALITAHDPQLKNEDQSNG